MIKSRSTDAVLGVTVGTRTVHAVLLEKGESGPVIVAQFMRQRNHHQAGTSGMSGMVPDLTENASGSDFMLEFGEGSPAAADVFLPNEFGGQAAIGEDGLDANAPGDISVELAEILEECGRCGVPRPTVMFCLAGSNVSHVELRVARDGGKDEPRKDRKAKPSKHSKEGASQPGVKHSELIETLKSQHAGEFNASAVGFIPMAPASDGARRFLALVPKPDEPVLPTVKLLREQPETAPTIRGLETEASILLGLARVVVGTGMDDEDAGVEAASPSRNTLLVRVGSDDTLVLFLRDSQLMHVDSLKSLTSFDSPETICSRLLLQQDEQGIDEIHHVLLLGQEKETRLVETFRMFFPDADVRSMRRYLPQPPEEKDGRSGDVAAISALGAGLRLMDPSRQPFFDHVNLIPKKLLRTAFRMPFGWPSLALIALVVLTGVFFVSRYSTLDSNIDEYRDKLRSYPPRITHTDPQVLQARIDSMNQAYAGYMRALDILDTLLIGSDRWSTGMEKLSNHAASVSGIWVTTWRPTGAEMIEIQGSATSRDRVVRLAERLNANIETLTFSEIREMEVFEYRMDVPIPSSLPRAAIYLRQQVDIDASSLAPQASADLPVSSVSYSSN